LGLGDVQNDEGMQQLQQAIEVGEKFSREHPRARHASSCALIAARALTDVIKKKGGDDFEQMVAERERLFKLGKYMAEHWPGDRAGDYGAYLVAFDLIKRPLPEGLDAKEKQSELARRDAEAIRLAGDVARLEIAVQRAKDRKFLKCIQLLRD